MRKKRKQRAKAEEAAQAEAALEAATAEDGEASESEAEATATAAADEDAAEAVEGAESEDEGGQAMEASESEDGEAGEGEGEGEQVIVLEPERVQSIVESYLFAADKPLSTSDIHKLIGKRSVEGSVVQESLDRLTELYQDRGIVLHCVGGAYQLRTHPDNSEYVQRLVAGKPVRLSRAQLETLAIIAYRQPITRPEIDEIRGVDSGGTLRVLLDRTLIRILGKKEEPGRPLLYGTTKEFLEFFNLGALGDLPTLREYSELSEDSIAEVERLGHTLEDMQTKTQGADDSDDEGGEGGTGGGSSGGGDVPGIEVQEHSAEDGAPESEMLAEGSGAHDVVREPALEVEELDVEAAAELETAEMSEDVEGDDDAPVA